MANVKSSSKVQAATAHTGAAVALPSSLGTTSRSARTRDTFDLEERMASFAVAIIAFAKRILSTPVYVHVITQLSDAGTSIGANYSEACEATSKRDFRHNIRTCKKEARETCFWLGAIGSSEPPLRDDAAKLWKESKELNLIFAAIHRNTKPD